MQTRYAQLKPESDSGSERTLFPVALKMALASAGRIGGIDGSPSPVGGYVVFRRVHVRFGGWIRQPSGLGDAPKSLHSVR